MTSVPTRSSSRRHHPRRPLVIADTVIDYYNLLKNYEPLPDADVLGTQLVSFLKGFETLRENTILDYAPRYKDFLRHYGY